MESSPKSSPGSPRRRLPPLNWLRAFEAAARHTSFTEAANELAVTQAAVSQSVKNLEEWLGTPLFIRRPRSLELTEAGLAYLPILEDAFDRLLASTDDLFGITKGGPVTVRVTSSLTYVWLVPRLPKFLEAHPDISLRLVSPEEHTPSGFEGAEVEIRYGDGSWADVEVERLFSEHLFPVCAPHLCEGKNTLKEPADLLDQTLIHVVGEPENWQTWFHAVGVDGRPSRRSVQFDLHVMATRAAVAGVGVALGLWPIVNDALADGRLVKPFDILIPARELHFVVTDKRQRLPENAAAFRDWLIGEAEETDRRKP